MTDDEQQYVNLLLEQIHLLKEQVAVVRYLGEERRKALGRLYDERQRLQEELDLERSMRL